jgi:hypothetical protein
MIRFATIFIFLYLLTSFTNRLYAEDQVATIYFAGTSADYQWASPHATSWGNHEELISTLFYEHRLLPNQHKWFVDGIGSGCGSLAGGVLGDISGGLGGLFGAGFPGLNICRGWQTNLDDAKGFLDSVIESYPDDQIILNLVGWSRGGILAIRFAHGQSTNSRLERINILALDPVVGDLVEMWEANRYSLSSKVKNYVGLYAEHERSYMFGPTLPKYDPNQTEAWMLRLPGSHETMLGNLQKDGHSIVTACYILGPDCDFLNMGDNSAIQGLKNVYWVTKVFAQQLLGTPDWGDVRFDWNWFEDAASGQSRDELFNEKLDAMWSDPSLYTYMQNFAFTPLGLEDVTGLFGAPTCGLGFATGQQSDRCTINYDTNNILGVDINTGLINNTSPMSMIYWELVENQYNQAPVADAGPDQVVECTSPNGTEIGLDGSGSSDPDGDQLTYTWDWSEGSTMGETVYTYFPVGTHTITLTVNDGNLTDIDTVDVTVMDSTAPRLSVSLSPNALWPPNNKLMKITASIDIDDSCDDNPTIKLVSITSNEAEDGIGDGHTSDDIQGASFGTDDREFLLRAERTGQGIGRIYTVTYEATDASGNVTDATAEITVSHDQGGS